MSCEIKLSKGKVAVVDDADFQLVSKYKWSVSQNNSSSSGKKVLFYAVTTINRKTTYMHRLIALPPTGLQVDHRNHDTLDNRRQNLRVCSRTQNQANRETLPQKKSRFRGVHWNRENRNWVAHIKVNQKGKHLGAFSEEGEAAKAYDAAAECAFGEYAILNYPEQRA